MMRRVLADMLFMHGAGLLQAGEARRALWYLATAARFAGASAEYWGAAALAAFRAREVDAATRHAERALEVDPDLHAMRDLLAELFVHGEVYDAVLKRIHAHLQPRTYVEIGIETGRSLAFVKPPTRAVGIDPQPQLTFEPGPHVRVFRETSDDFFARHDLRAELGGLPVDLAFIDGLHLFEYALRDFMNLERHCHAGSTIVIDDCFPRDRRTAARERVMTFWTGDVWKLVVLLKRYRPELAIHTVATPPCGLCIVRNLDPQSRFIADNLQRLTDEFMALDYAYLESGRAAKLNLVPNDWDKVRALLQ